MIKKIAMVSVCLAAQAFSQTVIDNIGDFGGCLNTGWNVAHTIFYGNTCRLKTGSYQVSSPLIIARSNISIEGEYASSIADSKLVRAAASLPILQVNATTPPITGVSIKHLEFDGNRFNTSLFPTCPPGNYPLIDVDIYVSPPSSTGTFTIEYSRFVRAAGHSLRLDGSASTVSFSQFSTNGPNEANRSTSLFLRGTSTGAYYNHFAYAGTAGVNVQAGSNHIVYGNTFSKNRYEMSDGSRGGQLYIQQDASTTSVAANVINGDYWQTNGSTINGCTTPLAEPAGGIETYGNNHRFYNNAVIQHLETGQSLSGTSGTIISGSNPWNAMDQPRCYQRNLWRAINIHLPVGYPANSSLTLDSVRVVQTNGVGVYHEGASGVGFVNGACMFSNTGGDVQYPYTSLTNPTPSPITSCTCPY